MKLSEESSKDTYDQSKMERLPNLKASASENFTSTKNDNASWNGSYGLSSSITLYQGGSVANTIEQNKLRMEQSSYQTSQYDNTLTIKILEAFLTVLSNEELLKYQTTILKTSEEQVNQGKEQFRVGMILESDYQMLEAQLATVKNNIKDTKINRDNNLLTLKSLLAMDMRTDLQIIYPDTAVITEMGLLPSMDYVLERAMNNLPDLIISQYNIDIAKTGIKLSKAGYMPTLSLSGSIGTGHSRDFANYGDQLSNQLNEQAGLSLSIPIYTNNRNKSKVTQSRIALQQAELDKKQMELDIAQNVAIEYQDVVSSYNKYLTNNVRQDAYQKTFEAYNAQFKAGAITAVDLLQQQNNYISALNDFIQSKYGFMLKRKVLDVYMAIPITM
jgi:outer membrane protein